MLQSFRSRVIVLGFLPFILSFCNSETSSGKNSVNREPLEEGVKADLNVDSTGSPAPKEAEKVVLTDPERTSKKLTAQAPDPEVNKSPELDGINSSSHYIIKDLPAEHVKDGSVDYTFYIQMALDRHDNLVFPNFPLLVNDTGLRIKSDQTLTFLKGSEIRLKASAEKSYAILDLKSVNNVTIYNPVIKGDRYVHQGTSGEWGMGISIKGSTNIKIYSPKITDCWGDGIYIGQIQNKINSKDILIKDAYLSKNRRDGISVISVDGLLLENIYAGYTDGTKPMTGINFEPNNGECELKNIRVINPRTEFNGSRGIQVAPRHMLASNNKVTDITIINHIDIGSIDNAFKLSCIPKDDIKAKMSGQVKIINPSWRKTANNVPLNLSTNQRDYLVTISSPEVINTSGYTLTYPETYSLLIKQLARAPLKVIK